ncbi:hypothetical protein D1157_10420 [Anaerotruncus sp. X29]|nr:hypothetical protein [Anaerotruncus sp. 1XD42-93]NCE75413.1 hypothetical protein [Anaerotruncus sp. X29]RKJ82937.1 hypothetical protein D7Y41_22940 [Anaerotruncus sp. 1XD22-93]
MEDLQMPTTGISKPFKSLEDQVDLLESRGLIIDDRDMALEYLQRINYYKISAYSLTLRKNDTFYKNIHFSNIIELYDFDNDFRLNYLKYSIHVETAFKSYIAYYHTREYGPLGYLNN